MLEIIAGVNGVIIVLIIPSIFVIIARNLFKKKIIDEIIQNRSYFSSILWPYLLIIIGVL
jgi:hypothetical protein